MRYLHWIVPLVGMIAIVTGLYLVTHSGSHASSPPIAPRYLKGPAIQFADTS